MLNLVWQVYATYVMGVWSLCVKMIEIGQCFFPSCKFWLQWFSNVWTNGSQLICIFFFFGVGGGGGGGRLGVVVKLQFHFWYPHANKLVSLGPLYLRCLLEDERKWGRNSLGWSYFALEIYLVTKMCSASWASIRY